MHTIVNPNESATKETTLIGRLRPSYQFGGTNAKTSDNTDVFNDVRLIFMLTFFVSLTTDRFLSDSAHPPLI